MTTPAPVPDRRSTCPGFLGLARFILQATRPVRHPRTNHSTRPPAQTTSRTRARSFLARHSAQGRNDNPRRTRRRSASLLLMRITRHAPEAHAPSTRHAPASEACPCRVQRPRITLDPRSFHDAPAALRLSWTLARATPSTRAPHSARARPEDTTYTTARRSSRRPRVVQVLDRTLSRAAPRLSPPEFNSGRAPVVRRSGAGSFDPAIPPSPAHSGPTKSYAAIPRRVPAPPPPLFRESASSADNSRAPPSARSAWRPP